MPSQILMPALSPTMEDGTLARWLVKAGDRIAPGDVIAEIETDKATLEFEADRAGTLGRIIVAEGATGVAVGTPIAELEGLPEAPSRRDATLAPASPRARHLAHERGVDLETLTGSGPGGRIVARDIEAAPMRSTERPQTSARSEPPQSAQARKIPLDSMRQIIATRLSEAHRTVPQYTLRRSIRADSLLAIREEMNTTPGRRGPRLTLNDFVLKACATALQQVPAANVIWGGDHLLHLAVSDLAVAIATPKGLMAPVIRHVEDKTLSAISSEMAELSRRARSSRITADELHGASLAVSNLGMHGVESFDAIVTPPHSAILAVGSATRKPVVDAAGGITASTAIQLSLSLDHRVTDGAQGAELLSAIAVNLEHPLSMLT